MRLFAVNSMKLPKNMKFSHLSVYVIVVFSIIIAPLFTSQDLLRQKLLRYGLDPGTNIIQEAPRMSQQNKLHCSMGKYCSDLFDMNDNDKKNVDFKRSKENTAVSFPLISTDVISSRKSTYSKPSPCSCGLVHQLLDLGSAHYPRYIPTGVCKADACWGGMYRCREKYYKVRVLRQREESEDASSELNTSLPESLYDNWVSEAVTVVVACECSP